MDHLTDDRPMLRQARKIRPTRRSVSGVYNFRRTKGIPFESTLERDFLVRTCFFDTVEDAVAQPLTLSYVDRSGRRYQYTPDFLVTFTRESGIRPLLAEVKPAAIWRDEWREMLPKWKAAWRYAREHGFQFHIYDESRIRDDVLANILYIERFRQSDVPQEIKESVIGCLRGGEPTTLGELIERVGHLDDARVAERAILQLMAGKIIGADLSTPISRTTRLWGGKHGQA